MDSKLPQGYHTKGMLHKEIIKFANHDNIIMMA